MKLRDQILAVAAVYQGATGLTANTISKRIFAGNGRKLAGLRQTEDPQDIWTGTFETAMQVMSDTWPEGAEWPKGVKRPPPADKSK